jgi:hypothetical protein
VRGFSIISTHIKERKHNTGRKSTHGRNAKSNSRNVLNLASTKLARSAVVVANINEFSRSR